MEGTNNSEMVNEMITELTAEPEQESGMSASTNHLMVGEEYKITGGKFKKYKVGTLVKINNTYSDGQEPCSGRTGRFNYY